MRKYRIKLNEKVYEVEIEEITENNVEVAVASSQNNSEKFKDEHESSKVVIVEAPMPGAILGVSVKAGDKVEIDQVLLILEAMKMENEIVSPVKGTVISVNVTKGDSVNSGDLLIKIG